jgi:sulfhydrogenase subunit gamma (sulfur reductase)
MITPEKPLLAEIIGINQNTADTKTFTVRFVDKKQQKKFFFAPGKFMMVSVFGFGEVPISISSSPYKTDSMQFTVVKVGTVTEAMHGLKKGSLIGLRGPFGNGFPMQRFRKKNILFVSGGCGLAPLRSVILAVQEKKKEYGKVNVLFGCETPANILFPGDMKQWEKEGFSVLSTVDEPDKSWKGNTGVVTKLFSKIDLPPENTIALMCGPPVMIHFTLIELRKKGFKDKQMYASLERMMQCGVGYCSHCNIGNKYTCIDGPVFNAADLEKMPVKED